MAPPKVPPGCPLTSRQYEALRLLGEGLTSQQAARQLGIAYSSIRSLNNNAFKKLGCTNTTQAISVMGRRGWVDWEPPDDTTPLAVEHPFLAAYVREFEASRWPHSPDLRSELGMKLALAGHRNRMRK